MALESGDLQLTPLLGSPRPAAAAHPLVVMGLDLHPWNVCSRIVGGGLLPFQAPDPRSWLVGGGGEGRTSSCPCSCMSVCMWLCLVYLQYPRFISVVEERQEKGEEAETKTLDFY